MDGITGDLARKMTRAVTEGAFYRELAAKYGLGRPRFTREGGAP
jgi:hypothetical protein